MKENEGLHQRGKLLVVEGGVAAGKSTQIQYLWERFLINNNWDAYREPGGTGFGELMRTAVQMKENYDYEVNPYAALFAYSAARAQLMRQCVLPILDKGKNVLLDRYWYSTWAYQGTEGVNKLVIWAVSLIATKNTRPDCVLFYDLSPEIAVLRRSGKDDLDRYDKMEVDFHRKVRKNYRNIGKFYSKIWNRIDANQPIDKVHQDTVCVLKKKGII